MNGQRSIFFLCILCSLFSVLIFGMEEEDDPLFINMSKSEMLPLLHPNKNKKILARPHTYSLLQKFFCDLGFFDDCGIVSSTSFFCRNTILLSISSIGIIFQFLLAIPLTNSCNALSSSSYDSSSEMSCSELKNLQLAGKIVIPTITLCQLCFFLQCCCIPIQRKFLNNSENTHRLPKLKNPNLLKNKRDKLQNYVTVHTKDLNSLILFYSKSKPKKSKKTSLLITKLQNNANNYFNNLINSKEKAKSFFRLLPEETLISISKFAATKYKKKHIAQLIHSTRKNSIDLLYDEPNFQLTVGNKQRQKITIPDYIMEVYEDYMPETGYDLSCECKVIEDESENEKEMFGKEMV